MFIKIDVINNQGALKGNIRLRLDWQQKTWSLLEDPTLVWPSICKATTGKFEFKDWGVLWIWDNLRHLFILWDAPNDELDIFTPAASGAIFDPVDSANFKDGKINWSIDFTPSNLAGAQPKPAAVQASSPFREHLLKRLNELLDAPYLSKNYDTLTGGLRRTDPGVTGAAGVYTSCGSMPGFVTFEMGTFKGLKGKAHQDYMNKYSLNGTNIVRIKGLRYNCWRENDLVERPIPGDIYALLNKGDKDKKNSGISHVGVIQDCAGNPWKTMDLGQGSGFDGKKNAPRDYKADIGELYGETNQGGGYRVLAGWVNVDDYLKLG